MATSPAGAVAGGAPAKPFVRLLGQAVTRVHEDYPDARLLFANGASPDGPSQSVEDFGVWRFAFTVEEGTVFLQNEKPWDSSFLVQSVPHHLIGARAIPVPSVQRDTTDADKIIKDIGHYAGPYSSIQLSWPLAPGVIEPVYNFKTPNAGYWSVGVYTGRISHHA
ncbi:hypothetical protein ABT072_44265 [Streptomyces sp. NPDC002589]|uniref:hypothetical protein n=1 Tax=Streptomyces sp. NPDC002589 TaxID=3154420 RepID=UPI003323DB6E